jgi:hypothetical protein
MRDNGRTRAGLLFQMQILEFLRQHIRATFSGERVRGLPACGHSFSGKKPAFSCLLSFQRTVRLLLPVGGYEFFLIISLFLCKVKQEY